MIQSAGAVVVIPDATFSRSSISETSSHRVLEDEVLGLSQQFASQILDRTCLDAIENVEHLYISVIRLTVIVIDFTLNKASMHKLLETIVR